jgi:flavin-dependent thymidylate synthase
VIHIKGEVARYADVAMYDAQPDPYATQGIAVEPQVTLVSMTHNPVRVMAAAAELYAGRIVGDPYDVTKETALKWFEDMTKTALQAPLEFIDFHFLIQGVTRAFTHQMVRQRTGVYVQESQRFAVKRNGEHEVAMPPSIARLAEDAPQRVAWESATGTVTGVYKSLVDSGIPAEDARGLLPTNITTRLHYKTNLRNLAQHAGMRLCSQAQYEWKQVWNQMINAIWDYGEEEWETEAIVSLFKPICFQTGKCEFQAETDRWCSIRSRVNAHAAKGSPPAVWVNIDPLDPCREGAARLAPDMKGM